MYSKLVYYLDPPTTLHLPLHHFTLLLWLLSFFWALQIYASLFAFLTRPFIFPQRSVLLPRALIALTMHASTDIIIFLHVLFCMSCAFFICISTSHYTFFRCTRAL
uniref:Uncharacterized protein n=1 Tax=Picea glauca TaxID=3330 RepID=A0A124GNL3_PICGL|nr:hypothetical protein ABT39_MTgene3741 [Picea glauca]QHR87376.1 hypothetical protein Q903MT_gene1386 [Picea sitchensis]